MEYKLIDGDSLTAPKTNSVLRYAGGKSRALKIITPYIPDGVRRIVSPFAGGLSLEIHWASTLPVDEVVAYDVFPVLVNFWQTILSKPDALADALADYKPTKTYYTEQRLRLKEWWEGRLEIKNKVELAALYYYNHQLSYGPMFLGWQSSVMLNQKVFDKTLTKVRDFRCPKLKVEEASFATSIPKHQGDFLYLDPPYYLDEGKVFKGIYPNPNFAVHHNGFDHKLLSDLLHQHEGGYVMSYNDCKTIRRWYKDCDKYYPKWHYSFQQGEQRIGKNRIEAGKTDTKKKSHEILLVKK